MDEVQKEKQFNDKINRRAVCYKYSAHGRVSVKLARTGGMEGGSDYEPSLNSLGKVLNFNFAPARSDRIVFTTKAALITGITSS